MSQIFLLWSFSAVQIFWSSIILMGITMIYPVTAIIPVPIGKYPFIVQVVRETPDTKTTFNCTGSIIHPRYVLTALSCLIDDAMVLDVNYTHVLYDTNRPQVALATNRVDVEKFHFAIDLDNFTTMDDNEKAKNNIAIIQVASEFPLNNNVNTTVLSNHRTPYNKHFSGIVVGFGGVTSDGERNVLREYKTDVPDFLPEIIPLSLHNTKIREGEEGGPLLIQENGQLKQYGIASHNLKQSNGKITPIFSKLGHHCDWIQGITKDLVKCE